MEQATGRIMHGVEAPLQANLDAFLVANPGWEPLPLEDTDTSEDEKGDVSRQERKGFLLSLSRDLGHWSLHRSFPFKVLGLIHSQRVVGVNPKSNWSRYF